MKEAKEKKNESAETAEEVVEAKGTTAVAVAGNTQPSTTVVKVRGLQLEYATMKPFYSVCGHSDAFKRQCHEGDVILKRGSDVAFKLMEPGDKPVKAIVLDGQQAVLEGRPIGGDLPRVWAVGRTSLSGETPQTLQDCWRLAEAEAPEVKRYRFEDYNKVTNPIPEHYLAEALYLRLVGICIGELSSGALGEALGEGDQDRTYVNRAGVSCLITGQKSRNPKRYMRNVV